MGVQNDSSAATYAVNEAVKTLTKSRKYTDVETGKTLTESKAHTDTEILKLASPILLSKMILTINRRITLSNSVWSDIPIGGQVLKVNVNPKSTNSIIFVTSNISIGGNTGSGNLYFKWVCVDGSNEIDISVSKADVSGTNRLLEAGWGIQTV